MQYFLTILPSICRSRSYNQAEFREYRTACHRDDIPLPRRNTLIDKVNRIDALIKRVFTPLELQEKVDRQNALKRRFIPINRERVRRELEEARAIGDETRAADLQD
ncbi:MAG: hypothetical protein MI674_06370, partial [Cytophagales bacterium]|nr:hypothetical protein [Cytophagales bacterium]